MTTQRDEIVIEGSDDGVEWREYEFRYKPGDVARRAALEHPAPAAPGLADVVRRARRPARLPWFSRFLERLLENEPTVTALLEENPFPDKPPLYVRAQFYDYTYASSEEKAKGLWWDRRSLGLYFPAVRLRPMTSLASTASSCGALRVVDCSRPNPVGCEICLLSWNPVRIW